MQVRACGSSAKNLLALLSAPTSQHADKRIRSMTSERVSLTDVLRLRAGLSPLTRVADVTVHLHEQTRVLDGIFEAHQQGRKPIGIVTGQYGSGKTHFLLLAKMHALAQGFAV